MRSPLSVLAAVLWALALQVAATAPAQRGAGAAQAPAGPAESPWEVIDRLDSTGHPEEALALLQAIAPTELPLAERLRAARIEHRLLQTLDRGAAARESGRRWIAVAETAGNAIELAEAYRATGRSAAGSDLLGEAEELFRSGLASLAPLADATPELEANLLLDLAGTLISQGEYIEADSILGRADRLAGSSDDPRLVYRVLAARGTALHRAGDPLGALEQRRRALVAADAMADPSRLSTALANLAQTEMDLHDYAGAIVRLRRVLELGPGPRQRIITLASIGICQFELNQLAEAARTFDEARRLAAAAGNQRIEGWALGEMGLVEWERGRAESALELYDRAIESCRRSGDRRNEIVWWINKGRVRRDQERWQEALASYAEAERLERSLPGQRPRAGLRKQIGECHAGLGNLELAEELFHRALELAEPAGNTKVIWETQRELARLYARTGRMHEARDAWDRALDGIETIRGGLRLESLEADFFSDKITVYAEAIAFLLAEGGPEGPAQAFAVAERARARAFLSSLSESRAALHETVPAELVAEERRLLNEISRLQAADRRGEASPDREAELVALEASLEVLELRVRTELPRFSEIRGLASADLAAVQRVLAPDEVLLEYFLATPASHLWVVGHDSLRYHPLPAAAVLDKEIRGAYTQLLDPASEPRFEELAHRLLEPITGPGQLPAKLLIVPSGILHYLPFEALPVGGDQLVDRAATSYSPSASALVELRGRPRVPRQARLLAVGDPPYESAADPERVALGELRSLGVLPHTRREVQRIRARFGRRSSTVLLGSAAAEGRLKAEPLESYSVLHLAVHGWIDSSSAARCALVLGSGPGQDDGVLQFREILRLRLAADLVALSACQSALGELVTGEGMVGLARAFFYAGSETVVATLWSVADEASAELMASFYEGLADGLPKAEALRRARLAVRSDRRFSHPYYWAPFVLIGRGENTVEVPGGGPATPVVVATFSALLVAIALFTLWRSSRRRNRRVAQ